MKIHKILLCVACTFAIGTCSSTISMGESQSFPNKPVEAQGITNKAKEAASINNEKNTTTSKIKDPASPEAKNPATAVSKDDRMLVKPGYNCDPKMLIPGNPGIDPKFLVKPAVNKKK